MSSFLENHNGGGLQFGLRKLKSDGGGAPFFMAFSVGGKVVPFGFSSHSGGQDLSIIRSNVFKLV